MNSVKDNPNFAEEDPFISDGGVSPKNNAIDGVQMDLLFPKILQFSSGMYAIGWSKFSGIFFAERGLKIRELGYLRALSLFVKLIGYPFWGLMADVFGNAKLAMTISIILSSLLLEFFRNGLAFETIFILYFVRLLRSFANSVWSLVDAITLKIINKSNKKEGYGKQRVWCAISWGTGCLLVGILIDRFDINVIFYFGYVWGIISILLIQFFSPSTEALNASKAINESNKSSPKGKGDKNFFALFEFIKSSQTRRLSLLIFVYFAVFNIQEVFLPLHLDSLNASKGFIGMATFIATLSEIPMFFMAEKIVKKFGKKKVILLSYCGMILRLLGYSFASENSLIIVLICQSLHGICFSLPWCVYVNLMYDIAPDQFKATSQSILGSLTNVAAASGAFSWGLIFDFGGARSMYFAGIVLNTLLFIGVYFTKTFGDVKGC